MRATDKPFNIDKMQVYEAYKAVKSNAGAAGVDGQTIEQFETDLKSNLYKIWNRMSSGSYFPPPVRAVSIPKKTGGDRILGVPTVADRVAQMVVKQVIEPNLDPVFLPDSYAYRPLKSALDAVGVTRERCWKYDWVVEFDIKGLFDHASQYPPQEPTYASKVRCLSLPALSLRSAASVAGLSGKRYSFVRASRERAMVPLLMRS
jgi:RNA-directed DNA polymerase